MEYLRKLKWDIWSSKFKTRLRKKCRCVMSETDKIIAP